MSLQDRLDELTTDRDRRFQEREIDRAEQVNGNDYNPVEINPWTGQAGDVASNGQIPPGMPVTELQTPEGGTTIEGPNSPRPRPKPQPKKPYLETTKPVVVGYLSLEDYTSQTKLVSACWEPPGYVAVAFTVERDTNNPVDYTCARYEFVWRENGDGECRPTPNPEAPYETMAACRNDPNNKIWQARDGTPLGISGRDYPDEPPGGDYADKGASGWNSADNERLTYSLGLVTCFFKVKFSGSSSWELFSWTVGADGSNPFLTALRLFERERNVEAGDYNAQLLEIVDSVSGDRRIPKSYIGESGFGYAADSNGVPTLPDGYTVSIPIVEWIQSYTRAPGSATTVYGAMRRRAYSKTVIFQNKPGRPIYWADAGEGGEGGQKPPLPSAPGIPSRDPPASSKKPEQGKPSTVERQFWVSEPNEQDPNTYKAPYKVLGINAEEDSEAHLAYWRKSQGFVKHGRHIEGGQEKWCESTQFGDASPDPWNSGVGKSLELNPPASLNRSPCGQQFAGSLTHNVLDSTLRKVVEIDPQQLVTSITSTPTTVVRRPLDQELEIAVADARFSDPAVRNIAVKVKVYDILSGSGCNLSAPVERDAIVNRFMLQSIASTTTVIAPGYPIEEVPKAYSPIYGSSAPPTTGATTARRYWYYWRHSNGEETRVEIPVEILRTDPVKAYLTQTGDRTAIAVLKIGEKTEEGEVKACRVVRATIDLQSSDTVAIQDFSIDATQIEPIDDDWQTDYTRDRLIEPDVPDPPAGTMVQWNLDNGQRGNLRIADSQAIVLEGDQNAWALGQALKVKVWAISDFPSGTAEEIESNFAPITEGSVSIVAASAVLATGD